MTKGRYQSFECRKCKKSVAHTIKPIDTGAAWICSVCDTETVKYTKKDMIKLVSHFRVKPNPEAIKLIPKKYNVYLKYGGPDATEMQVDRMTIEAHVQLTNELPLVGKPLFAMGFMGPDGLCFTIPYGEVTRIET